MHKYKLKYNYISYLRDSTDSIFAFIQVKFNKNESSTKKKMLTFSFNLKSVYTV